MGKKAKEHRKKVAKRNNKIQQEKDRAKKSYKELLLQMIEKEKAAGAFDNTIQMTQEIPTFQVYNNEQQLQRPEGYQLYDNFTTTLNTDLNGPKL